MVQIVKALRVLFSVLHPHPWFELRFGRVDTLALAGGGGQKETSSRRDGPILEGLDRGIVLT